MGAYSSREFNQNVSAAKRAAKDGPVFITDRERPTHVLMTIEEYRRLNDGKKTIVELLAIEGEYDHGVFDAVMEEVRASSRSETPRPFEFD